MLGCFMWPLPAWMHVEGWGMVPGWPRRLLRNGSGGGSAGTDPLGASERCCASSVKPGQQEGWDRKQHSHVSTPWTFQVQALPGMTIRRAVEAWAVGCMDWVHRFNPRRHVAMAVQGKRTSLTKERRTSLTKESRKCHRSRPSCG